MVPAVRTVKSIAAARKAVREASAKAQQERARRERDNIEDLATFLVARARLAAVDDWEAEKVAGIAAAAARRRDEQRGAAAEAICRIRERGVTVADIAKLASIAESDVRAYIKAGNVRRSAEAGGPGMNGSHPIDAVGGVGADAQSVDGTADVGGAP
jgi:hypothetical protein